MITLLVMDDRYILYLDRDVRMMSPNTYHSWIFECWQIQMNFRCPNLYTKNIVHQYYYEV